METRFKLKYTIYGRFYAVADGISRPWSLRLLRRQVPELLRTRAAREHRRSRRRTSSRRIDWRVLGAGTRGSAAAALMRFRTAVNRIP